MAQQDGHETTSGEDYNWGSKSVRHHCSMVCKHFAHAVLHKTKGFGQYLKSNFFLKKVNVHICTFPT